MAVWTDLITAFQKWMTQPTVQLGRTQRALRWAVELVKHCALKLYRDRATEVAAALTYRTIFSLIPILVLGLLLFNAFGGFKSFGSELQDKFFDYMGLSNLQLPAGHYASSPSPPVPPPAPPVESPGPAPHPAAVTADDPAADAAPAKLTHEQQQRVAELISGLTDKLSSLNFKSIGVVGLLVFIWAALALVITAEEAFNRIYDCPIGRPWRIRIPIYWAVITLGPALLGASLWLTTFILGLASRWGLGTVVSQLTQLGALLFSWLLLYLLYTLLPNAQVARRPALAGSLVAAFLFEVGKFLFGWYVTNSMTNFLLYGSMALIPLFLFWIYITWLIVLFGLELTYSLQAMRQPRLKYLSETQTQGWLSDPHWVLPVMACIGEGFRLGKPATVQHLTQTLALPHKSIEDLLKPLEARGFVHTVSDKSIKPAGSAGYTLSRPAEEIRLADLLQLVHDLPASTGPRHPAPAWSYLHQLNDSLKTCAQDHTLASIMNPLR